jgi:hypothetical protein
VLSGVVTVITTGRRRSWGGDRQAVDDGKVMWLTLRRVAGGAGGG